MLSGTGIAHLASYLLIVVLACFAYGALFMLAGLFFKNPMVPAILFLGWETMTPFLPTFLKVLSFVHYLVSFAPVPVNLGAFALPRASGFVVDRLAGTGPQLSGAGVSAPRASRAASKSPTQPIEQGARLGLGG